MAFQLFWDWTSIGLTLFLTLFGALMLILPGRFVPAEAGRMGLGRHVEALILVAAAVTFALGGMGNVPVYAGPGGVVAVSLLGGVVPTILALYFLFAAGLLRFFVSLFWVALVAVVAFYVSEPVPGLGIVARPPGYYLPAIVAAVGGLATGLGGLRSIPLAYAYGVLGGLIGADLLRIGWIVSSPFTAASIGGAEALDLVFLLGLWGAALAGIPLLPRLLKMRRVEATWVEVAARARAGDTRGAVDLAEARIEELLRQWTVSQAADQVARDELLERSTARPVLRQVAVLRATSEPWNPEAVRRVLENLEGLARRLAQRPAVDAAPRLDRFAAGAIDAVPVILIGFLAALLSMQFELEPTAGEAQGAFALRTLTAQIVYVGWTLVTAHVLVPFFQEWIMGGESLGKRALGLRVRHVGGGRPGGWDLFVRNVARLLDLVTLYLIPFVARRKTGRQRLGDYFAQTYVQRGPRAKRPGAPPVPDVPALAPGAARALGS